MSRRGLSAAMLGWAIFMAPGSSYGAFHLAVIDEVMTSYGGDPSVQFIEIRMLSGGQNIVAHSVFAAFDINGNYVGDILEVPANVANSPLPNYRWLVGTSQFQVVSGITPDFVIPATLPTPAGMICWGGASSGIPVDPPTWDRTNFNNYIDCIAYGGYVGPSNSRIGTPTSLDGVGHSMVRISTVIGNNATAFTCGDPATPTNNTIPQMPGSMPATSPCPPTPTPTGTPTSTPTVTNTPTNTPIQHDAVVLPPKPLSVKIPLASASVTKKIKVGVRNGNTSPTLIPIKLTATACGGATVTTPDFDSKTMGAQDTILLGGGKSKKAAVEVTIPSAGFTSYNAKSPERCQLTFQATADLPMVGDPNPSNDIAKVELNVLDLNDPVQTMAHESVAVSIKPVKVKIDDGAANELKNIKLKVTNADDEADPGHAITVTLGAGTCVGVGLPDFDKDMMGVQNTAAVEGEKSVSGVMQLNLSAANFSSPNKKSPARCTQLLCADGPGAEPNPTNDCTELIIDVTDENDF